MIVVTRRRGLFEWGMSWTSIVCLGMHDDPSSGQDFGDSDSTGFHSVSQHRDVLAGLVNLARVIAIGPGVGVDFDLAINEVDDPVCRNTAVCVIEPFLALIAIEARFGDFDQVDDVGRTRVCGL